jgi:hypothetical protein
VSEVPPGSPLGLRSREALVVLLLFCGGSLAFAGVSVLLELGAGDTLVTGNLPGPTHSVEDALWHLGTGFLLALPARRRVLLWLGPLLALGIDADHVFGGLFPTVVYRGSHSLVFLVVVVVVLYRFSGPAGAGLGAGGFLVHLAVDGGAFPLFAPLSIAAFPLPLGLQVIGVGLSALCTFLAVNPWRELTKRSRWLPMIACAGALAVVLATVAAISSFNGA